MKNIFDKYVLFLLLSCFLVACNDSWDQHYDKAEYVSGTKVEVYNGSVQSYMESQNDLSVQYGLFQDAGIYNSMAGDQKHTVFVYSNDKLNQSDEKEIENYAKHCISSVAISPDQLVDGLGIYTRYGKTIWVYAGEDGVRIDEFAITKCVNTSNAFVYHLENVIPLRKTIYDVLNELGDEYSIFKNWVLRYEETVFDKEKSTPSGYDAAGNIVYSDSVYVTRNKLMNRYTSEGLEYWNMMDERFASTMLVPSNEVIQATLDSANARVTRYLGRPITASDRFKFEDWIVKVSFYNQRLSIDDFNNGEGDIEAVGEYMRDSLIDKMRSVEPAVWRTSVQKVHADKQINASNGNVYFIEELKIPNYLLIHRQKAEIWKCYNSRNGRQYYELENWINPTVSTYGRSDTPPPGYPPRHDFNSFSAIPSQEAQRHNLTCSVTFDGLTHVERADTVKRVILPAGDYYMMIGSQNRRWYSISIYFNDAPVIKNLSGYGTGADLQQDTYTGKGLDGKPFNGYPEYADVWRMRESGYTWGGYDGDGYPVGVATMTEEGYFKIKIESEDHAGVWSSSVGETTLVLFHYTLRPTKDNY